jgi:hypothetical protein
MAINRPGCIPDTGLRHYCALAGGLADDDGCRCGERPFAVRQFLSFQLCEDRARVENDKLADDPAVLKLIPGEAFLSIAADCCGSGANSTSPYPSPWPTCGAS